MPLMFQTAKLSDPTSVDECSLDCHLTTAENAMKKLIDDSYCRFAKSESADEPDVKPDDKPGQQ